jgi:hypothetical protein
MSQAAGPFVGGLTAMFDATTEASSYRAAARVDKENARLAELDAAYKQEDIRRRGRAVQGEAISALAEGGNAIGEGSAGDLIYQNALEIEYAALGARYQGRLEAHGYRVRAAQEKTAAKSALIGGLLRAGAAAITGMSTARNQQQVQAAQLRQQQAYFPGGMTLPMPPPAYAPQYRPGP